MLRDTTHDATPACMNRCNRTVRGIRDQDRNTVRSLHSKNHPSKAGHRGVSVDRLAGCGRVVNVHDNPGMNLFQLYDWPARSANCGEKSLPVHLDHGIGRIGRTEREIIPFRSPCRERMNYARNTVEDVGMNEGYLVLTLYL